MLINSTVADVARKLDLTDEIVTGVLNRWITTEVNWDEWEKIEVVGVDEIALKRGHRDYVVLVTVPLIPKGVEVLAVLSDRKKETVANFFASIPPRLQKTVKTICTDMYQGFVNAAQEQLPGVKIVIDRYHVAKAYRDCADKVRKQELKVLKRELSKDEYEQVKGAMWPFRKCPAKLKNEEKQLLERLFSYSPRLKKAYILREDLTEIFERDYTKAEGKNAIQTWCQRVAQSNINEFKSFLLK